MNLEKFDKIIIGAGLYGLYSAWLSGKEFNEQKILIIESDEEVFSRATSINQARVHMGYHYPRSYSTAIKSAQYFKRFNQEFDFCIHKKFDQIYATAKSFSWTNARQFESFCRAANIRCDNILPNQYFNQDMCDGSFLTEEYTYDWEILKNYFLNQIKSLDNVTLICDVQISNIVKNKATFILKTDKGSFETGFLLNATYASVNQIIRMLNYEPFKIKYELCEIILCKVNKKLANNGITVMDGPFFSIMPFGKTGLHSLTSVSFTPHATCYEELPEFPCQKLSEGYCNKYHLGNCNICKAKPKSAWPYMFNLAKKYLNNEHEFTYEQSLYSMKPILMASEVDDSRPTIIRQHSTNPTFISVLSGKINTIYDLEEVLRNNEKQFGE